MDSDTPSKSLVWDVLFGGSQGLDFEDLVLFTAKGPSVQPAVWELPRAWELHFASLMLFLMVRRCLGILIAFHWFVVCPSRCIVMPVQTPSPTLGDRYPLLPWDRGGKLLRQAVREVFADSRGRRVWVSLQVSLEEPMRWALSFLPAPSLLSLCLPSCRLCPDPCVIPVFLTAQRWFPFSQLSPSKCGMWYQDASRCRCQESVRVYGWGRAPRRAELGHRTVSQGEGVLSVLSGPSCSLFSIIQCSHGNRVLQRGHLPPLCKPCRKCRSLWMYPVFVDFCRVKNQPHLISTAQSWLVRVMIFQCPACACFSDAARYRQLAAEHIAIPCAAAPSKLGLCGFLAWFVCGFFLISLQ